MVSRRELLRGGAVAGVGTMLPAGALIAGQRPAGRPYAAFCVTGCDEGEAFLQGLQGRTREIHGIGADPGRVLDVLPRLLQAGQSLIGLTPDSVLFVVERQAEAAGYRNVFHGDHRFSEARHLEHRLDGEGRHIDALGTTLSGDGWPATLAATLSRLAGTTTKAQPRRQRHIDQSAKLGRVSPGHLVSWVFVPA